MKSLLVGVGLFVGLCLAGCAPRSSVLLREPIGSSRLRGYPQDPEERRNPPVAQMTEMRAPHEEPAHEGIGLPGPIRSSGEPSAPSPPGPEFVPGAMVNEASGPAPEMQAPPPGAPMVPPPAPPPPAE